MRDGSGSHRRALFSKRTSWDTTASAWGGALEERRRRGLPLYDLTMANPTECGFNYSPHLLAGLTAPEALRYAADPRGIPAARKAVCAYYADHQRAVRPRPLLSLDLKQIFLTASTSEAYSFLFRLLCDPGDEVLIAQPSYPLFEFLADLDDVRLVSYPLFYDHGWHLDLHSLRRQITQRTRAIVIVHPNNPTGQFTREQDRAALEKLAVENNLALIVDEVFLDYAFGEVSASFALGEHPALTFVLSGLSKIIGLPQMKLSWIGAFGPQAQRSAALARLEMIADTFLSVSAPVQHAMPQWLAERAGIQEQIRARVKNNLAHLDRALLQNAFINRLDVEGGWYAILRVPETQSGEVLALKLLESYGVVIHPGSFFGMAEEGRLVVSLLPPAPGFEAAVDLLLQAVEDHQGS